MHPHKAHLCEDISNETVPRKIVSVATAGESQPYFMEYSMEYSVECSMESIFYSMEFSMEYSMKGVLEDEEG